MCDIKPGMRVRLKPNMENNFDIHWRSFGKDNYIDQLSNYKDEEYEVIKVDIVDSSSYLKGCRHKDCTWQVNAVIEIITIPLTSLAESIAELESEIDEETATLKSKRSKLKALQKQFEAARRIAPSDIKHGANFKDGDAMLTISAMPNSVTDFVVVNDKKEIVRYFPYNASVQCASFLNNINAIKVQL